jgi:hypothetical protein
MSIPAYRGNNMTTQTVFRNVLVLGTVCLLAAFCVEKNPVMAEDAKAAGKMEQPAQPRNGGGAAIAAEYQAKAGHQVWIPDSLGKDQAVRGALVHRDYAAPSRRAEPSKTRSRKSASSRRCIWSSGTLAR